MKLVILGLFLLIGVQTSYAQLDFHGVYVTTTNEGDREFNNNYYCYWEMTVGYFLHDSGNLCGAGGNLFSDDPIPLPIPIPVSSADSPETPDKIEVDPFYIIIIMVFILMIYLMTRKKKKKKSR